MVAKYATHEQILRCLRYENIFLCVYVYHSFAGRFIISHMHVDLFSLQNLLSFSICYVLWVTNIDNDIMMDFGGLTYFYDIYRFGVDNELDCCWLFDGMRGMFYMFVL